MKKLVSSLVVGLASVSSHAAESHAQHTGPYPPAAVMGSHTHHAGGWMLSYRYMKMHMDGNRDGTNRLSTSEVLADYMVTPLEMDMEMHMFGAMYAPSDKLTVMAMLPYTIKDMKHVTRTGRTFTTDAEGIGDLKLSGLYQLRNSNGHRLHLNMGISAPSGDVDERDDTPAGNNQKLPYPMQLGSGTWDLLPGITYAGSDGDISWGAQAVATLRLGENDEDYTLGDRLDTTAWLQTALSSEFTASVRVTAMSWGDIDGADPDLNPNMISTADPNLRAGTRADILLGIDYAAHHGAMQGHRLGLEVGQPVYQNLDGPQLETDWIVNANWQFAF